MESIEQLKSCEDQMEMMAMVMMMHPEFYNDIISDSPPSNQFSASSNTNLSHFVDNNVPPSIFLHPNNYPCPNTTSTSPLPIQDQNVCQPAPIFESNSTKEVRRSTRNGYVPVVSAPDKRKSMAAMREMIFRMAAMQPINIDPESVKPPKRRNVKISKDPQSVAARHRRERISERIRILQRLVPGGTKMDTASMLDEAIHYVKFLKTQVQSLEQAAAHRPTVAGMGFPVAMSSGGASTSSTTGNYFPLPSAKSYQAPQNVQNFGILSKHIHN